MTAAGTRRPTTVIVSQASELEFAYRSLIRIPQRTQHRVFQAATPAGRLYPEKTKVALLPSFQ